MKAFLIITLLVSVAISQNPVLSFDCASIPEVCTNMCWGVHCTSGTFSGTLTADPGASSSVKAARRRAAGCLPSPNQCSNTAAGPNQGQGLNCDEFPFASTREADQGGQNIRCVPTTQNSQQGGTINGFYRSTGIAAGTAFDLAFLTPTAARYCVNQAPAGGGAVCGNDGKIFNKNVLAPDAAAWTPRSKRVEAITPMYLYETERGEQVSSASLFEVGRELWKFVPRNDTLGKISFAARSADMGGDDDLDLELVVDRVLKRLE
ncbi:deoxyribonuclease NucA/NucB-domain-containing protein [Cadophora sp. MPI-SDFR-AT-0126]|nr:deoxyribonuclease NucA/NucB-domain-containing protein [Leotiomycetes sp. MPI-SDFR-AT-0126]